MLLYFFIGLLAYLDSGAFGAGNVEKAGLKMDLRIVMTKSVKALMMTRLRRQILLLTRSLSGTSNKYTFCKVSQIVFSKGFTSAKCIYFRKYAFAEILRFCKLSEI